jgi:UDP-glucose 4-epimerase
MKLLVTGGAGFIGSHFVHHMEELGHDVWSIDNLSGGDPNYAHRDDSHLIVGDVGDSSLLQAIFCAHRFEAVVHFASNIQVAESVREPMAYYQNNIVNGLTLLDTMVRFKVQNFVFSSSAAVYGHPESFISLDRSALTEDSLKCPISPYGRSKLFFEEILKDYEVAYGIRHSVLRYFNAAGAHPDGHLKEGHLPETHLIPLAIRAALGESPPLHIYGGDYNTKDGTCIRDYVHVCDLASAHQLALDRMVSSKESNTFNLGSGGWSSIHDVLKSVERVTGKPVPHTVAPRRPGDPAYLVANSTKAESMLGWKPLRSSLDTIVRDAVNSFYH